MLTSIGKSQRHSEEPHWLLVLTSCSLRAQIGVVPQAPILFDDTIMNNVRYAKLTATDEEVYEACKAASIHDQILTFADGEICPRLPNPC